MQKVAAYSNEFDVISSLTDTVVFRRDSRDLHYVFAVDQNDCFECRAHDTVYAAAVKLVTFKIIVEEAAMLLEKQKNVLRYKHRC